MRSPKHLGTAGLLAVLIPTLALFACRGEASRTAEPGVDPAMKRELVRLSELYNVLGRVADKVWPGWTGWDKVPHLFEYENNVRMLVGHPEPPQDFQLVEGLAVNGLKTYLDRRAERPVPLSWPTSGGGGPIPFGSAGETPVTVVSIKLTSPPAGAAPGETASGRISDDQILLYVHELFHVFQHDFYTVPRHGNLSYNPDANFAIYSEVEGEALRRAFLEKDDAGAREFLEDFIVARKMKYRSMTSVEQAQEKEEDFAEGTARYAEYATLLELKKGFRPLVTRKEDPAYSGFAGIDAQIEQRLKDLEFHKGLTLDSRGKCYQYGCFQALLLNRVSPGWQATVPAKNQFLFDMIAAALAMDAAEEARVAERLEARYDLDALTVRHTPVIEARDRAFKDFDARAGRTYIVNFKPTREFVHAEPGPDKAVHQLGLRNLYPGGIKRIAIREVLCEGTGEPVCMEQLYHLRYVDMGDRGYTVKSLKNEGDVHYDAVITTPGFVLKAPKVRVKERGNRVKLVVLEKVRAR
jgi:hypothetical protein